MKVVFMGTPEPAVPTLERIIADGHKIVEVWTQPDRPSGRGKKLKSPPVKVSAEAHKISVFQPEKVRKKEIRERFASLDADVAVVVAYGQILTKTYLNAFPHGCINVHFSLLPKYRGAAPVNWAIANGEKVTGVTTMKMDRGLDTGDILLVEKTDIGASENSLDLMERLADVGAQLLAQTLRDIDSITPVSQDDSEASYASLFAKSDGVIDWSLSAEEIRNRVLGFQPFPGSFTFVDGEKRLIIQNADVVVAIGDEKPGTFSRADEGFPVINCGVDALKIVEAQIAGKPKQRADSLVAPGKLEIGQLLRENSQ